MPASTYKTEKKNILFFLNLFIFLIYRFFYIEISLFVVSITFSHLSLIPSALSPSAFQPSSKTSEMGEKTLKTEIPTRLPIAGVQKEEWELNSFSGEENCDGNSPAEIVFHSSKILKPVSAQPSDRLQVPKAPDRSSDPQLWQSLLLSCENNPRLWSDRHPVEIVWVLSTDQLSLRGCCPISFEFCYC